MAVFFLLAFFVSCTKEAVSLHSPSGRSLLTGRTWQLQSVTEVVAGNATVVYQQGKTTNAEDYSLVRQSFLEDGGVRYTDQFGNTGTDGEYEMLEGGKKIRLAQGTQEVLGMQVYLGVNEFSYTVKISDEDAVQFRFWPIPE